ncbi:alpha/beta fold hydrolase, partial [Actinomadura adrarensis]
FAIAGYSLGTPVAVRAATRHSDRVTALVLTSGFAHPNPRFAHVLRLWRDLLREGEVERLAAFLPLLCLSVPALESLTEEELAASVKAGAATTPPGTLQQVELATDDVDVRGELADIRVPTLVISTTLDQLVTPSHHRELADAIPGARFAELATGHLPFAERPGEWAALIREFFDSL